MKLIPLTKGLFAKVDDEDYDHLMQWTWFAADGNWHRQTHYYAMRSTWYQGKVGRMLMHREIMKPPQGMVVDHLNHDTLDNRRCNLRACTIRENSLHRNPNGPTPVFKGYSRNRDKWLVRIKYKGASVHLGRFDNEEDAATMYNVACQILYPKKPSVP